MDKHEIGVLKIAYNREMCRRQFFFFVKEFWDVIIKEEPVYNWHIPFLCQELQTLSMSIVARKPKPYDLIINIPPGTTKSTIVTVMWPAWLWTKDPTLRVISNSYSGDLSLDHASKSKDIVTSDKYQLYFPEVKIRPDKSAKGFYETTQTGARYSTSTGGTITGKHGHVIINDDPQNPKQASSEPLREQATEHTKTLASRKVNKENTPVVTIMQRLHEDDVTGYLLKKKADNIKHICLPADLSDNVKPMELKEMYIDGLLDPVRLSRKVLDEAKIDLGSKGYSGQYGQSPTVEGGNIIKEEWFRKITYSQFQAIRGRTPVHFFLDTAYDEKKKKTDNDPSGIIATSMINNSLFIFDAKKLYKQFPDLIKFLLGYLLANGYDSHGSLRIEPKANGKSVIQQLQRETKINVTETPSPADSKETRLNASSPSVECGRVYLVEGEWNEEFIDEVCGFPFKTHDEYVDLLCYAIDYHLSHRKVSTQDITKESLGLL